MRGVSDIHTVLIPGYCANIATGNLIIIIIILLLCDTRTTYKIHVLYNHNVYST